MPGCLTDSSICFRLLTSCPVSLSLADVMASIYACEQNCSLGSDWDGGWHVAIGGSRGTDFTRETWAADLIEAAAWLHEQALELFPEYSQRYGNRVIGSSAPAPVLDRTDGPPSRPEKASRTAHR